MSTQIWAHRGASAYAPENTLEAFQLALDMGADGIELDIQLSADGELMVLHDDTIDRTSSGTGRLSDMTLWQLKELDFSMGMSQYAGARIPTLREVYRLLAKRDVIVNVEIKAEEGNMSKFAKRPWPWNGKWKCRGAFYIPPLTTMPCSPCASRILWPKSGCSMNALW